MLIRFSLNTLSCNVWTTFSILVIDITLGLLNLLFLVKHSVCIIFCSWHLHCYGLSVLLFFFILWVTTVLTQGLKCGNIASWSLSQAVFPLTGFGLLAVESFLQKYEQLWYYGHLISNIPLILYSTLGTGSCGKEFYIHLLSRQTFRSPMLLYFYYFSCR